MESSLRSDSTEHSACAHSKDSEFPKIFSPCGAQNSRKFSALERRMRGGRYLTFSLAVYANAPYTYRGYTQVKFLGELDERQKWEENFTSE